MRARQRHWGNVLRRNPERECQRLATAGVRVERGLLEHRVEGGSLITSPAWWAVAGCGAVQVPAALGARLLRPLLSTSTELKWTVLATDIGYTILTEPLSKGEGLELSRALTASSPTVAGACCTYVYASGRFLVPPSGWAPEPWAVWAGAPADTVRLVPGEFVVELARLAGEREAPHRSPAVSGRVMPGQRTAPG